ncbi:MAG: OmpA family protein [Omnitrophica WOR_2 bacterium]|jgi:outer membrane protein OmpA-like peptidoglycan-associated protein
MKKLKFLVYFFTTLILVSCSSMNKSQKGAVIGAAGGGATGAVIGRAAGNTAMGAIIGATVGGVAGAVIGRQMDKQAAEMEKQVPGAKVERVGEGIVVEFNGKVLFGFDKSDLTPEATQNLNSLTEILNKYPDTDIVIQGHTDNKGTDKYNQTLSERRAYTVSNYLASHNIASSRLKTIGYGESQPKYSNDTESGRAQNRRVEFLITANEKMKEQARKEAQSTGGK